MLPPMKSNSKQATTTLMPMHGAAHDDQRVGLAGVFQRFLQALGVFAAVLELQGVDGQHLLADFVAAFGVQKER
jgi:hypothetical protein